MTEQEFLLSFPPFFFLRDLFFFSFCLRSRLFLISAQVVSLLPKLSARSRRVFLEPPGGPVSLDWARFAFEPGVPGSSPTFGAFFFPPSCHGSWRLSIQMRTLRPFPVFFCPLLSPRRFKCGIVVVPESSFSGFFEWLSQFLV